MVTNFERRFKLYLELSILYQKYTFQEELKRLLQPFP